MIDQYYHYQVQEEERGSQILTVYLYTLSDRLILKSRILDGYADSLMLLIFVKVKLWTNGVIHLPIGLKNDPNWAFSNILKFLYSQKERVERKEITASTLRNYVKTIKMFCEVTDIVIQWKKITRGFQEEKDMQMIERLL